MSGSHPPPSRAGIPAAFPCSRKPGSDGDRPVAAEMLMGFWFCFCFGVNNGLFIWLLFGCPAWSVEYFTPEEVAP